MRCFAIALLLAEGCAPKAPAEPAPRPSAPVAREPSANPQKIITLLGTNDLHGHIERLPVLAGYLRRLRQIREHDGAVLALDAGDMFQGTLESNLNEGAAVIAAYDSMGFTAAALGNHDFDYGPIGELSPGPGVDPQGALEQRLSQAKFPLLSSNLIEVGASSPKWPNLVSDALVLDVAGVKVGIVGGLTEETPSIVMPAYFEGLAVRPLAESIARGASHARRAGARLVIAVVHAGAECTRFDDPHDASSCDEGEAVHLARALPTGAVDAILAGHTHKGVAHFIAGAAVAEAFCYGRAFSRIDVTVPKDAKAPLDLRIFPPRALCSAEDPRAPCAPEPYEGAAVVESEPIASLLAPYVERARSRREESLGVLVEADVDRDLKRESPLGNLSADLLVAAVDGADVAIVNGGSLRAPLRAGVLHYGDLYESQPFDNRLAVLKLTGRELLEVLRAHLGHDHHGIVSLAGVRLIASCKGADLEVELRRRNGKRVRVGDTLTVVVSDYLATGGDELFTPLGLTPDRIEIRAETVRDAMARVLKARARALNPNDKTLFDPAHPRLALPSPRPVRCGSR
jgi:2',3'-cyclic-nucleotide 2'-phosphodiesterase (5'-nucleotidase family)